MTQAPAKSLVTGGDPDEIYDPPDIFGEFTEAPDIEAIAEALIKSGALPRVHPELTIKYLWKRSGGKKNGACQLVSGLTGFFAACDFVVWLAYDKVVDHAWTRWQVEALTFHELCHINFEYDKNDNLRPLLYDHEFEGFRAEIQNYGHWQPNIEDLGKTFQNTLPGFGVTTEKHESPARAALRLVSEAGIGSDDLPALDEPIED